MPEAVIVASARTPIGRARKGSLVDARPDGVSAFREIESVDVSQGMEKVLATTPAGFAEGKYGRDNLARVRARLAFWV